MTTSPVMSLTDELVAELEEACREHQQGFMIETSEVIALLRERAEMQQQLRAAMISVDNCELFRKDAERLEWLSGQGDDTQWMNILRIEMDDYETLRDAVDEIMRQES